MSHIEVPFNTLAIRADPDQATLVCLLKYDLYPDLVDLTSNFFVLCKALTFP